MTSSSRLKIAVIGHVEHVTIARVDALPHAGEIVHLDDPIVIAGGGGGIAFHQLAKSDAELHLFTAFGNDGAARAVEASVRATGAHVHAARRDEPHTRDIVLITPNGERTIIVIGEPLHPAIDDPLPWDTLRDCDAVYFTAQDPAVLGAAREAKLLVVTARRKSALDASGVRADVVVGSARDPREASALADYAVPPGALVMTEGASGGRIETANGIARFPSGLISFPIVGSYGAGDSFAGALVWYLATGGVAADWAFSMASAHGVAVLRGVDPIASQRKFDTFPEPPVLATEPRLPIDDDWDGWIDVRERIQAAVLECQRRARRTLPGVRSSSWEGGNDMILCSVGASFRHDDARRFQVSFSLQMQARRELSAIRVTAGLDELVGSSESEEESESTLAEIRERDLSIETESDAVRQIWEFVSEVELFLLDRADMIAQALAARRTDH